MVHWKQTTNTLFFEQTETLRETLLQFRTETWKIQPPIKTNFSLQTYDIWLQLIIFQLSRRTANMKYFCECHYCDTCMHVHTPTQAQKHNLKHDVHERLNILNLKFDTQPK